MNEAGGCRSRFTRGQGGAQQALTSSRARRGELWAGLAATLALPVVCAPPSDPCRSASVRKRRLLAQYRSRDCVHHRKPDPGSGDRWTRDAGSVDGSVHHAVSVDRARVLAGGVEDVPALDRSQVGSRSGKQLVTVSLQRTAILCVELRHVGILCQASDIATGGLVCGSPRNRWLNERRSVA